MTDISSVSFVSFCLAVLIYFLTRRKHSSLCYPPGPKVTDLPAYDAWIQYRNWGREYGELVYVQDKNTLIINHSRTAIDLLQKRARISSDRRVSPMKKLCGAEFNVGFTPYSDDWRRQRKHFQGAFRQGAIDRYYPNQYDKVHEFLQLLIATPDNIMQQTMALSQRLMFSGLYGIDVRSDDPLIRNGQRAVVIQGQSIAAGGFSLIDRLPWLRFMPSWLPGFGFKRTAEECVRILKEAHNVPFDLALDNLKTGKGTSVIAELVTQYEGNATEIEAIKTMGTSSYLAAADATMSSISSFLLSMVLHPDVQAKGQEEIDSVLGRDRLPTFADRLSLPYVEAIYREVMRLHPPVPLCVEHSTIEDDFYLGYHIPKGCSIIPNIWAMNRDPAVYSRPDEFLPDRFLDTPTGPFTSIADISSFGFGRRICPGRYMGDSTVWLVIAYVLATLNLSKRKDKDGNEIEVTGEYTNGFYRHPKPFQCSFTTRDLYAEKLVFATTSK